MYSDTGTMQEARTGTTWTGGWIAAALLTAILAAALFATFRGGDGVAERVPASPNLVIGSDQLSGGGHGRNAANDGGTVRPEPIRFGNVICHQCR
jgi:hypothetical protein